MKSKVMKTIISLLTVGMLAISSQATIVLQDNFDSYATGNLTNNSSGFWLGHSGANPVNVVADSFASAPNALQVSQALTQDVHAFLTNGPYADPAGSPVGTNVLGNPITALYASMMINVLTIPATASQTYFTHFEDSGTFKGRVFIVTNGAATGNFRLAIQNSGTAITNIVPMDLSPNTGYTIVTRYIIGTGQCTLWVSPNSETNTLVSTNATDTASVTSVRSYSFRQNTGEGIVDVDNLVVGTAFADVVPGSVNPPSYVIQPADNTTVFVGGTATFTNLAVGDPTIKYQWYYNTNTLVTNNNFSVSGATNIILVLTNISLTQSGIYSCVSSNASGTNVTRFATLSVNSVPVPPAITNQPASITNNTGDTTTFTVLAGGSQPLTYQWKVVPYTNSLLTNLISGATTATLTLTNLTTSLSSNLYFVTITNQFGTTNSAKAQLIVKPIPVLSIAQFRSMVDTSFAPTNTTSIFTIQGIVTTWADMTGVANSEFFIQDASGGIAVFWSGANATTNLPPAGALVQVTGPMAAFNGLVEIEPVFGNALQGVTIISTNNPLPKAQPLVFDPNVSGYPGTAKTATTAAMEGMYFVASNVMLNLSTPNFVSGANDFITNNAQKIGQVTNSVLTVNFTNQQGQQYVLFINAQSGLPGQAKYTGPVTIYGVLGYFTSAGFEFTPSRFADVISYSHVTNILVNARKGDLATNAYTENVVRPGESLTTYVSIGDAAGGSVTLTPIGTLPTGATWSGITSGSTATAVFSYSGDAADTGNNFPIQLAVTSTAGTSYTETFNVYVPTADEQQIAITEFLANPTTNPAASFYNPLARPSAVNGISTNDQFVEIANLSATDFNGGTGTKFTLDTGNASTPVFSSFDGNGADLPPMASLVVYGGNGSPISSPGLTTSYAVSKGLFLPTSGSGLLVLRNSNGNIIDRVVYSASDLTTNGSLSRFPTFTSVFVPQVYISTNLATAGLQYDGGSWASPTKVPTGVTGVGINYVNGQAVLNFTATTTQASTLWDASDVTGPYSVIFGRQFPTSAGTFTNVNSATKQFYFITTQ